MPFALPLIVASLWSLAALADKTKAPFDVTADEVEYQADRDIYVGRGHVVITQGNKTLTADHVLFSNKTRQGVATGNVVVTEGGDTLKAPFLEFNIDTIQGVVFDGRLDSTTGHYRMEGKEVRKTGPETYEFEDGNFTTCRCPKDTDRVPWSVTAQKATLDLDGLGRARNSTFDIFGVPVLWTPYMVYPLKRERQTGFLFPQGGTSAKNGYEMTLPFFWAPSESVGVMVLPQYQTKRGFKPAVDVEYLFGERGAGEFYATGLHDIAVDPWTPQTPYGDDRWGLTWRHQQDLPYGGWMAAKVAAVSDNGFPFDFNDFRSVRYDRYLPATGLVGTSFGGETGRFTTTLAAQTADDLQNPNDQDRDKFLLERLPRVDLAALPASTPVLPGLVASAGLQLINFQWYQSPSQTYASNLVFRDQFYDTGIDAIPDGQERNNAGVKVTTDANLDDTIPGIRTGPERDGRFEEGEPLADHGQRVITHPRLSYPFQLGNVIEVVPEAGYYGTFYESDLDGGAERSLFTGRLDVRAKIRGTLSLPFGLGNASHVIEPFVGWVGVSNANQNGNPLFVPPTAVPQERLRLLEPDNVTLDPADRIEDASNVLFGVSNRFWGDAAGNLLGEFGLYAQYQTVENLFGPLVAEGEAILPQGFSTRFHSELEFQPTQMADNLVDLGWTHGLNLLSIRYRYVRDIPQVFEDFQKNVRFTDFKSNFQRINQLGGYGRWQMTENWAVTYGGSFSFTSSISLVNQFGLEYLSRCKCWAVRLEIDEDRTQGFAWRLRYRLVGLGDQKKDLFTH